MNRGGRPGNTGRGNPNNRGRSPYSGNYPSYRPRHAGGDAHSPAGSSCTEAGLLRDKSSQQMSSRNVPMYAGPKQTLSSESQQWRPLNRGKDASPDAANLRQELISADDMDNTSEQLLQSIPSSSVCDQEHPSSSAPCVPSDLQSAVARVQIGEPVARGKSYSDSLPDDQCNSLAAANLEDRVQASLEFSTKDEKSSIKLMEMSGSDCKELEVSNPSENPDPFDICPPKVGSGVILKPSLLVKNRVKRNDMKRAMEGCPGRVLRPGMVHLKGAISLKDQVKVVGKCRELGLCSGGFYRPGYRDGGRLHLKMMCLGKNWDPETSTYGDLRLIDHAKPPDIPIEFFQLVEKAIKDSHDLIRNDSKTQNPELMFPWMKPNICLLNFYSQNGRLGLHQDRDESPESLAKGLPVVSFSIGDSAEFLFGDQRDTDQAKKVILESGDILIFGGKSRHIFHGVTAIHPNTAPKALLEETNLRSGRLNLTFRQY